jgi:hypothetical protein
MAEDSYEEIVGVNLALRQQLDELGDLLRQHLTVRKELVLQLTAALGYSKLLRMRGETQTSHSEIKDELERKITLALNAATSIADLRPE